MAEEGVPDGIYERLFRGRYTGTITAGNGVKMIEFTTDWPAPHKANMNAAVDGPTRYTLVADALTEGSLEQLRPGDEIRLTVAEHFEQGRPSARWQHIFGVDVAEPLPAVTDDEVGWVLNTIAFLDEHKPTANAEIPGMRDGLMGCCDRDSIVDELAAWVEPADREAIGRRVDAVLCVLHEVGYVVGVRDEDLPAEYNALDASAEGLVTLTFDGRHRTADFGYTLDDRHRQLLGPRPGDPDSAEAWERAATRIDAYRLVHRVEEPDGLGEIGADRAQQLQRASVERTIATTRRLIDSPPVDGHPPARDVAEGHAGPVLLYRGQLLDVDFDEMTLSWVATIESDWRPPFSPDVDDWVRVHDVPVASRAGEAMLAIVGQEVRVAMERYDPDDASAYRVVGAEPAPPLPYVTPDELGWTLSTIADRGRNAAESGRAGVAITGEVAATIAGWSDPDGLTTVETRVRAAIDVAREVGYAVTAYSHELDPTIPEADTQRLIVLTDSGREACIAWEGAHTARNVALLGERPEQPSKARAWDIAAGRVDSYRLRYGIEDPRGLGEPSTDRCQSVDRSRAERAIASAGRFIEPPSLGPDLGIGR